MPSHHQVFWVPHGRFLKLLGPKKQDGFPNQNNQYLSSNLLHSYGKPPFLMKVNHHRSSINGPCSFAILNHQQATSMILKVVFEEPNKSSLDINFRCYEHASRNFQTFPEEGHPHSHESSVQKPLSFHEILLGQERDSELIDCDYPQLKFHQIP